MPRSYYKGVALDYKAQNYDDEYSLAQYCHKYSKHCCPQYTDGSDTTYQEDEPVKPAHDGSVWSCLKYLFFCDLFS